MMHGTYSFKKRLFLYTALTGWLLDAFAKLRKATISFVMYVCLSVYPSVSMKQLGFDWKYFHENLSTFGKFAEKTRVSLNLTRTTGYLNEDLCKFTDYISLISFYNEKCFRQKL